MGCMRAHGMGCGVTSSPLLRAARPATLSQLATAPTRLRAVVRAGDGGRGSSQTEVSTKEREAAERRVAEDTRKASNGTASTSGSSSSSSSSGNAASKASSSSSSRNPSSGNNGSGNNNNKNDSNTTGGGFKIGLDPSLMYLLQAGCTGGLAYGLAQHYGIDLSVLFRVDGDAVFVASALSWPVLNVLAALLLPTWGAVPQGDELERLRHYYFMTSQVLLVGTPASSSSTASDDDEASVLQQQLKLEQAVGWSTVGAPALHLLQVHMLQPWNPPSSPAVAALGVAGMTLSQLATEFLVRGVLFELLLQWVSGSISSADTSSILFYGKVFGSAEMCRWLAGGLLLVLVLPSAIIETNKVRDFVRASVVGPVRDAAIFCRGDGINEPAYCDPRGFARRAARSPANRATLADVISSTKGWATGSMSSMSSVSSVASVDDVSDLAVGRSRAGDVARDTAAGPGGAAGAAGAAEEDETDDGDMAVLLSVETAQDAVAYWTYLFQRVLASLAINGAFLLTSSNLAASFLAAWLVRTLPLVLVEYGLKRMPSKQPKQRMLPPPQ